MLDLCIKQMDAFRQIPFDSWLMVGILIFVIIGIVTAISIKSTDTDKQAGDKRLVATVFLMSALFLGGIFWSRRTCGEKIPSYLPVE